MNGTPDADLGARRDDETAIDLECDSGLNVGGAVDRPVSVSGVTFLIAQVLGADSLAIRAPLLLACLLGARVAKTDVLASSRADSDAAG